MPENITDFSQEKGRAGRYANTLPGDNRYLLCFSIKDPLFQFKREMNPEESILNKEYRFGMISELLQMAKVLASDLCFNVYLDSFFMLNNRHHHIIS